MVESVSVVIPAKNEAGALRPLINRLKGISAVSEIIVVDDGSTDDTAKVSAEAGAIVVKHPYSKGNGAAIKSGARAATGDILVFMDGDGQHRAEDVSRLLAKLAEGFDLVVGARQSGAQASAGRSLANKIYNYLASYMTGHKVEDLTSGFRAVWRTKFMEFLNLLPNGFS